MQHIRNYFYRYLMITLGCLIMAAGFNAFFLPYNLLSGGLSGYCVLLYYLFGLPVGIVNIVINIPLFLAAYKLMSRDYFISTIYGTLIFSLCFDLFNYLGQMKIVTDTLLACLAGGVICGLGDAIIYRVGGSTGGTDIIGAVIQKHYSISIGTTTFACNVIVMAASCYFFGVELTLYTLLAFFVSYKTISAFLDGFNYKKSIIIISQQYEAIAEDIISTVGRGITYFQAKGGYTHEDVPAVFVVANLTQVAKIRSVVEKWDKHAFMIIQDASDVMGRGFTQKDKPIERPILNTGWKEADVKRQ